MGIVFSDTESSSVDEVEAVDSIFPSDHSSASECEIVTDSESDNPEDWICLKNLLIYSNEVKAKIKKQRGIFSRLKKRRVTKLVAKKCLLARKKPARVSKTIQRHPDIGEVIEHFAHERRVGADSWRRTGLLTFSGNVKRGPKVT